MNTGRQTTRTAPIEVVAGPDGVSFWATPLPWRKRNDLGNLINQSYIDSINESIRALQQESETELRAAGEYRESLFDWEGCLALAFPGVDAEDFEPLDIWEIRALLCAACDVNGLDLQHMIDPKYLDLRIKEREAQAAAATDGAKTTSSEDSGLRVVQSETSSN